MGDRKPLNAGQLRHIAKIQEPVQFQDTAGDIVDSWVDVFPKVYASIDPLSAREFMSAANLESKITARITIRYRPGLTAKMRVLHPSSGKVYNIEGVLPDMDSGLEYLTLPCSQGVNQG